MYILACLKDKHFDINISSSLFGIWILELDYFVVKEVTKSA